MSDTRQNIPRVIATLAAGALFGFGLSLSGMVQPEIVLSFLRFQDLGLLLVMGGGVLVTLVAYQALPRLLKFPLLGGVCPGPAIAGLGTGNLDLLWAVGGIALGALVQGLRAR